MGRWGKNKSETENKEFRTVIDGLKNAYKNSLHPLEKAYNFHDFHSPPLDAADFDAKPMVLLVGQYSVGKTTFIRYILEEDFPGIRIGPEPTTDGYIAVMHAEDTGAIPGNALVVDPKKQFKVLSKFGNTFLNRFQCSHLPNPVLESITFIDTPGILSGEKQRINRGYDFQGVLEWFADRVDRIILLFDAHKLDISDEFKRCIEVLKRNDDKIRIVLNKSDMINHQQLMRIYGALMWSLGKVFNTPEVVRVYIGSFWDKPHQYDHNRKLFEMEENDLLTDLQSLPRNATLRKLNDLIKRARSAKVHAYIISYLKKEMPSVFGKETKKRELIANLDKIYRHIEQEHQISPGDFPEIERMREYLSRTDFRNFKSLDKKLIDRVDNMTTNEITRLMALIPKETQELRNAIQINDQPPEYSSQTGEGGDTSNMTKNKYVAHGGVFGQMVENPFDVGMGEGIKAGLGEDGWIVDREREEADRVFDRVNPLGGKFSGAKAKAEMVKSKLPNTVLGKIWTLADHDKDGYLNRDEWALANHLMKIKLEGHELPTTLPNHLIPPTHKQEL
ncbi:hypothetical protein SNEBB_009902 [Seison nebaliae]|nr:hypothetical protein SNEBB_009902 [Seison nebaliae]